MMKIIKSCLKSHHKYIQAHCRDWISAIRILLLRFIIMLRSSHFSNSTSRGKHRCRVVADPIGLLMVHLYKGKWIQGVRQWKYMSHQMVHKFMITIRINSSGIVKGTQIDFPMIFSIFSNTRMTINRDNRD